MQAAQRFTSLWGWILRQFPLWHLLAALIFGIVAPGCTIQQAGPDYGPIQDPIVDPSPSRPNPPLNPAPWPPRPQPDIPPDPQRPDWGQSSQATEQLRKVAAERDRLLRELADEKRGGWTGAEVRTREDGSCEPCNRLEADLKAEARRRGGWRVGHKLTDHFRLVDVAGNDEEVPHVIYWVNGRNAEEILGYRGDAGEIDSFFLKHPACNPKSSLYTVSAGDRYVRKDRQGWDGGTHNVMLARRLGTNLFHPGTILGACERLGWPERYRDDWGRLWQKRDGYLGYYQIDEPVTAGMWRSYIAYPVEPAYPVSYPSISASVCVGGRCR